MLTSLLLPVIEYIFLGISSHEKVVFFTIDVCSVITLEMLNNCFQQLSLVILLAEVSS